MATTNHPLKGTLKLNKPSKQKSLIIHNAIFNDLLIHKVKPIGFTILTYLLYESRGCTDATITGNMIQETLNIKTSKTVRNYLLKLQQNSLIQSKTILSTINMNTKLNIDLTNYYNLQGGFKQIPGYIFLDYYTDEISWTIYCLLNKLQHNQFNNAMIAQNEICNILGIKDRRTIHSHINMLEQNKLITIANNITDIDHTSSTDTSPVLMINTPSKYTINNNLFCREEVD